MPNYKPVEPETGDHYFDLGVHQYATVAQIKRAFRGLALLFHPDKKAPGKSIDAIEFRRVREAVEILVDPKTRSEYDKLYDAVKEAWTEYRSDFTKYERQEELERNEAEEERARVRQEEELMVRKYLQQFFCETADAEAQRIQHRVRLAHAWARQLRASAKKAAGSVPDVQSGYVELGWPRIDETAKCDFCVKDVKSYFFACPLGGAAACGDCKYKFAHGRGEEKKAGKAGKAGGEKGKGKGKGKK